jgi:hypothetical protein
VLVRNKSKFLGKEPELPGRTTEPEHDTAVEVREEIWQGGDKPVPPFVCMFVQHVAHELSPCERTERLVPVAMATLWSGGSTC